MAKNLLQDMVKRKAPQPVKPSTFPISRNVSPSEPVKIPEIINAPKPFKAEEPVKVAEPVMTKPEVVQPVKVYEPVVKVAEPVKEVEKFTSEPVSYSNVETRFASINDSDSDYDGDGKSRYKLWIVALASALFLVFALSYLFSSAKITVNPKIKDFTANVDLPAVKDGVAGDLPFNLVVIQGSESQTVAAGAEKDVAVSAQGKAIIYNAFSVTPQVLAIDTRLEGSNGKLYKTTTKTTVPGMKGSIPGSLEVSIYASDAGADYNSSALDFKIFGFKGTPKYAKIYARSKGDITGGLKGKSSDISDANKATLVKGLKVSLQDKLLKQALGQIPSGFVLFKDAYILDTNNDSITTTPATNGMVTASLSGTLSGFLFEEKKLTAKIASSLLAPAEDATQVYIPNIKNLTFKLANGDNLGANTTNINFNISGAMKLVWKVDANKLVADMAGQPKKDFNTILGQYPNIDSAQLTIRPFWKTSFPVKPTDIKVMVNYPE